MFKRFLIFLLITSILSNGAMQLVLYSGYQMNKAYITSVFCINKDHPELHCDGQCFLARKLKDLDSKNKQVQENLKKVAEASSKFEVISLSQPIPYFILRSTSGYFEKPVKDLDSPIFHPPKLA